MNKNQVVIIGANIAGLSTALSLVNKTEDPVPCHLYEAHKQAWSKPCGGGFGIGVGNIWKEKYQINIPFKRTQYITVANWYKKIELPVQLFIASRKKIQEAFFKRIEQEDLITFHLGKKMNFQRDWNLFQKINVVATGVSGFTRKSLRKSFRDLGQFQYQIVNTSLGSEISGDLNEAIFYMIPKIKGYAWLFPAPEGLDIGIGGLVKNADWLLELRKFLIWVRKNYGYKILLTKKNISWGIPIPIAKPGRVVRRTKGKYFVGVGDAIDLPDPLTAAGIEGAWYSGNLLAKAIKSPNEIDLKAYSDTLIQMMRESNLANMGESLSTSVARNRFIFPIIFSLIPNFLVKKTINNIGFK